MSLSIEETLHGLTEKLKKIKEQNEPYQRKVRAKHKKMKIRLLGRGGAQHTAGSFTEKPPYERHKSAPSGFGGT